MTSYEIWMYILVAMVSLPFVVFLCVKFGTYAWFRGRQIFQDEHDKEMKDE